MSEFVGEMSTLTDSSENESFDNHEEPPKKRKHSFYSADSVESNSQNSSENDGYENLYPTKRPRSMQSADSVGSSHCTARDSSQDEDDQPTFEEETASSNFGESTSKARDLYKKLVTEVEPMGFIDVRAKKLMANMGYVEGKGLGKKSDGRINPIDISKQRGRTGLGRKGIESANLLWNSEYEVVSVEEQVTWLESKTKELLNEEELDIWIKEGPRKLTIHDETNFCDPEILKNILKAKTLLDELQEEEKIKARSRSNPFETIRGGIFLNRAAMKMANMDAIFDFMFTSPKHRNGSKMVPDNELLYFADVCAGPGGFSEYVLWKKNWQAKGFGFTLKGDNDFKLSEFYAGPCETFEPHYGVNGLQGDGDVTKPENISEFRNFVIESSDKRGVHFMMADGGFSVKENENIQEILSKQLYLCQFLVAMMIVRPGGHFVCKLFDIFTPFSVGLVYLMYRSFHKICIHKPNSSRPANSERYLICKWKKEDCDDVGTYMYKINDTLCNLSGSENDVTEIVPMNIMKEDKNFFNYVVSSNNGLGHRQVISLKKIEAFCRDTNLTEHRQVEMKKLCLNKWQVPEGARKAPSNVTPDLKLRDLFKEASIEFIKSKEMDLKTEDILKVIKSQYDWHCFVLSNSENGECAFYLGVARNKVYKLTQKNWMLCEEKLELSPGTLIYAERVLELKGEGRSQQKIIALHVIDAYFLGGQDVRKCHFTERYDLCKLFCKALRKPTVRDGIPLKVKEMCEMSELRSLLERRVQRKLMKSGFPKNRLVFCLKDNEERFFIPGNILFINATADPWHRYFSQRRQMKFYDSYNESSKSTFECPPEARRPPEKCFSDRRILKWSEDYLQEIRNIEDQLHKSK